MTDDMPPSEFGGKTMRNGVQPFPHVPTASERLSLTYRTGDPSGVKDLDGGDAFAGVLPLTKQKALREAEGALEKGSVWQEIMQAPKPQLEVE